MKDNSIKDRENVTDELDTKKEIITRKYIPKDSVTDDTDDTLVTLDTLVTDKSLNVPSVSSVTSVTCNKVLRGTFQKTLFDLILKHFYTTKNTPITTYKMAEKMGENNDSIRVVVNRKKEFFTDVGVKGRLLLLQLSEIGLNEINQRIENFERKEREKEENRLNFLKRENNEKTIISDTKNSLRVTKPKKIGKNLLMDFEKVAEYNPKVADLILDNTTKFLEIVNNEIDDYYVKIVNLPKSLDINIEDIRKDNLDKIISVEGRVTSFGEVKPVITEIDFECPSCGAIITIPQDYKIGDIKKPKFCSCGRRGSFKEIKQKKLNASFIQLEDLQEKTDNPHSQRIKCVLFNDLCNKTNLIKFTPGNEVRCSGILKAVPVFKNKIKTVFETWILEIMDVELIEVEIDIDEFSKIDINNINKLSKNIDSKGLQPILKSFAPEVYGYEEIKSALILQLANRRNNRNKPVRNKSNILLIGDPGVAKSILGKFVLSITPGSRLAVGGGSSAVGITASVIKEEDSLGGYRVEPGAMILAKEMLILDEMNNLSEEDKPKLQEGMSDQRISINKANIHVQMNVTGGMIGIANPIKGNFIDDGKDIIEQFNISSPILNRFDSIFVVKDYVDETLDKGIADRMIQRHRGNLRPDYNKDFLKKFFSYIRLYSEPKITNEIQLKFKEEYSKIRKVKNNGVKINPRFLESFIRMSISSAKLRQSKEIEEKDLRLALKILSNSQYQIQNNDK